MKRFTAALLMAFLVAATLVPAYAQANIPPHTDYFYVNDFADILSGETKNHIVAVNDDLHARTGAQIVITTVNFLDGADIEDYSLEMANSWGIGSEKNNGLLMLLAVSEQPGNRFMIQAGTDLRAKMPVSTFESILEEHFYHFFDAGSYDTAVRRAFDALALHIDGLYAEINAPAAAGPVTSQPAGNPVEYTGGQSPINRLIDGFWGVVRFIVITVVVIAVIAIVFGASFAGRRRHYGGPMMRRRRGLGGFFMGYGMGRAMRPRHHHHHHRPSAPRPPSTGTRLGGGTGSAPRSGGGGSFSGGGIGRSGGMGGSRPGGLGGMGGSRPMGGGPRSGGGGSFRGGGIGRR